LLLNGKNDTTKVEKFLNKMITTEPAIPMEFEVLKPLLSSPELTLGLKKMMSCIRNSTGYKILLLVNDTLPDVKIMEQLEIQSDEVAVKGALTEKQNISILNNLLITSEERKAIFGCMMMSASLIDIHKCCEANKTISE
jgi:hypothetical protein